MNAFIFYSKDGLEFPEKQQKLGKVSVSFISVNDGPTEKEDRNKAEKKESKTYPTIAV